ncbi:MAG TPA: primosomal protein N' [Bacillota bacterium]
MGKPEREDGGRYAEVIVDIAAASTDRTFHYRVPDEMVGVTVGSLVRVPFGPHQLTGFVVGLSDRSEVPPDRLRAIIELLDPQPVLTPDAVLLARWMAERYLCRFVQALRVMLPPPARRPARTVRGELVIEPAAPLQELAAARDRLERRAPRQAEALERLLAAWPKATGPLPISQLGPGGSGGRDVWRALARRGLVRLGKAVPRTAAKGPAGRSPGPLAAPTPEQAEALRVIGALIESGRHGTVLLHGVTGSGKTEVYLHAIELALARGRGAIVLVPEISLTPQMIERFRQALGGVVAILHSAMPAGERYQEWRRLRQGEARVAIGARSAVFAPVEPLGLIVVDEEHAASYKQEDAPRYHAREVALVRGRLNDAVVVLGSATPSVETVEAVRARRVVEVRLPRRIGGRPLPAVTVVDMRREYRQGHRGLFSRALLAAIDDRLRRRQQVLLFLNRRGQAAAVLCRECGAVERCPQCAVALTYHRVNDHLLCHYCGYSRQPLPCCSQCGGVALGLVGAGTQRVEQAVQRLFPAARVARMDADSTRQRGSHERIYRAFRRGEIDVLVGTQMVARGWDVPGVTLVGVVDADTALHLPDFRSAERTFELLVQVAGRAGRGDEPGEVIVQTFNPDHYAIRAARTAGAESGEFYEAELATRRELGYPPFGELVRLLVYGAEEDRVAQAAADLGQHLSRAMDLSDAVLLGPAPAPLPRLRGFYRYQLLLKGSDGWRLRQALRAVLDARAPAAARGVRVTVDTNPYSLL